MVKAWFVLCVLVFGSGDDFQSGDRSAPQAAEEADVGTFCAARVAVGCASLQPKIPFGCVQGLGISPQCEPPPPPSAGQVLRRGHGACGYSFGMVVRPLPSPEQAGGKFLPQLRTRLGWVAYHVCYQADLRALEGPLGRRASISEAAAAIATGPAQGAGRWTRQRKRGWTKECQARQGQRGAVRAGPQPGAAAFRSTSSADTGTANGAQAAAGSSRSAIGGKATAGSSAAVSACESVGHSGGDPTASGYAASRGYAERCKSPPSRSDHRPPRGRSSTS